MYSLQYGPQMDHNKYEEHGVGGCAAAPHFLDIGYDPSVHGLCTAYVSPIYGVCMNYIWNISRSDLRSVLRSDLFDAHITRVSWQKKHDLALSWKNKYCFRSMSNLEVPRHSRRRWREMSGTLVVLGGLET